MSTRQLHCLALALCPWLAFAQPLTGTERLQQFTDELQSLRADFTQALIDADGRPVQESQGSVVLRRPGRFRWDYRLPYEQHIVADGKRLWIYDPDLRQVTVKELDDALGNAPINLLSHRRALADEFLIRDLPSRDGLQWVELQPRIKDTDFTRITLGIDIEGMKVMELADSFGQATRIRFTGVEMNTVSSDEVFEFEPPAGVDVIGSP